MSKLSPMMRQYLDIKEKHSDCILFFRLGDFYEMFFDDAKLASRELDLTLTGKQCGLVERAPMCGVPFHAAETYIARLVEKGYKVAKCEQTEDPASAKGLVNREVVEIITPGTLISSTMLKEKENNYIASVFSGEGLGLAYCDISTGELRLTSINGPDRRTVLINELVRTGAREIICDTATAEAVDIEDIMPLVEAYFNTVGEEYYRPAAMRDAICNQFGVKSLQGLGIEEDSPGEMAIGALLLYINDTQKCQLNHIRRVDIYSTGSQMSLDKSTIKNLELTETLFEKKLQGSLLGVLDKTHTAVGSRKLKQWIKAPLIDSYAINNRLDAVEELTDDILSRNNIKEHLKRIYDFERLAGRIATGKANGKDLIALKNSCFVLPDIKAELQGRSGLLGEIYERIDSLEEVYEIIDRGLVEEPPFAIKEGGLIKGGYSAELDDIKDRISGAQEWIASLESVERERTGIKNLKVGFNKVFGYYMEVTKSYYDLIPEGYIRKQTLSNCERFITPELKEAEGLVLSAEGEINRLEYQLFTEIRERVCEYTPQIQKTSAAIAELDVITSFAHVAEKNGYVKPLVDDGEKIIIEEGRHPVIEQTIRDGVFVHNDTYIDRADRNLLIITGPNMAGKSTYMRQSALIVLMAQIGCFVPCLRAHIGICDMIFTRIGASDNLAQGQSTFYVEMSELSYILNTATERSLVILDEIGRGTSTYDGLSIAWSTAEYLCKSHRRIRTLFATHYHEMTVLEDTVKGIKNLNVDVSEENGQIVFLHKIVEGSASKSYGIHVAQIAGAPSELINRATEQLQVLNSENRNDGFCLLGEVSSNQPALKAVNEEVQLSILDIIPNPVIDRIKSLDLMDVTPSQALKILEELQEQLK